LRRGCLHLVLLLAVVAGGWLGDLAAAPVPRPKPIQPLTATDFIGDWQFDWGAGKGTCQLARDGAYFAQWYGAAWQGSWQFAPPGRSVTESGGTLTVTEYPVLRNGNPGTPMTWSVRLKPGAREGALSKGGIFRLRFVQKTKPDG
jgi:hypothetical protein